MLPDAEPRQAILAEVRDAVDVALADPVLRDAIAAFTASRLLDAVADAEAGGDAVGAGIDGAPAEEPDGGGKPERTPLAAWMRRELARRGWTQRRLAEAVGVSAGRMSEWLAGSRTPSPESCVRIADALDADVDYVLTKAGHRPLQWHDDDDPEVTTLIAGLRKALANPQEAATRLKVLRMIVLGFLREDESPEPGSEGSRPRRR